MKRKLKENSSEAKSITQIQVALQNESFGFSLCPIKMQGKESKENYEKK